MKSKILAAVALAMAMPEAPAVMKSMQMLGGFSKGSTPNKYTPHQGKREMARRVRQMQRDGR